MSMPEDPINPYSPSNTIATDATGPAVAFGSEKSLKRVADGLNLVYWGIAIILLSVIGGIVLILVFAAMGGPLALVPAVLMGVGVIAGTITGLTGRFFCLDVPEETNARSLIYAAVACDVLAILFSIATWIPNVPEAISSITNLLSLVATVLFIIFMKRIANFIRRPELADRAQSILTLTIVLIAFAVGAAILLLVVGPLAGLLGFVVFALALVMFLRYVRLILDLRKAIMRGPLFGGAL